MLHCPSSQVYGHTLFAAVDMWAVYYADMRQTHHTIFKLIGKNLINDYCYSIMYDTVHLNYSISVMSQYEFFNLHSKNILS